MKLVCHCTKVFTSLSLFFVPSTTMMVCWKPNHDTGHGKGRMRKGALTCSAVCCVDRVMVVKIVLCISWFMTQNPLHDEKKEFVKTFSGSNLQC